MEAVGERLVDLRRLVGRWTAHMTLQPSEREEIVSNVALRLLSRLSREGSFGDKSLTVAMVDNVGWAVARHCEAAMSRSEREQLIPVDQLPEIAVEPPPCAAEQTQTIDALMEPLSDQERELLLERYLLGLDSAEVAALHHMRPEAVTMCCSRARAKALDHARREDSVAFSPLAGIFSAKGRKEKAPEATRMKRVPDTSQAPARRSRSGRRERTSKRLS